MKAHLRYTAMVFFTFTLLELTRSKANGCGNSVYKTIGDIKRYLQNQQLIYLNGTYNIVDISKTNLNWDKVNYFAQAIDINNISWKETQLVFKFNSV